MVLFVLTGNKLFSVLVFGLVTRDDTVVVLKLLLSLSVTCFGLGRLLSTSVFVECQGFVVV